MSIKTRLEKLEAAQAKAGTGLLVAIVWPGRNTWEEICQDNELPLDASRADMLMIPIVGALPEGR